MTGRNNKRNPDATKQAILQAAERLFVRKGYAASSLSDIAEEAEITKSLIHHYFGSKEALWLAVSDRMLKAVRDFLRTQVTVRERSAEMLESTLGGVFEFFRDNPDLVRFLAWLHAENDDRNLGAKTDLMAQVVSSYKDFQLQGVVRADIPPRFLLIVFWILVEHWFAAKRYFGYRLNEDLDTPEMDDLFIEAALKIYFQGVLPR
jgi:TetR/AcrR family transcriptional regulator